MLYIAFDMAADGLYLERLQGVASWHTSAQQFPPHDSASATSTSDLEL